MASGIIFFAGAEPPPPKGFLGGTVCSAVLSVSVFQAIEAYTGLPVAVAQAASAGCLLVFYKSWGAIFPPAAVLTGTLAGAASTAGPMNGASFLVFPWLAGHALLYLAALG